jgi:hypothetical protein
MISDIAQHEGDLVEIAEVVDDLWLSASAAVARPLVAAAINAPAAVKAPMTMLRRCIGLSIGPVKAKAPVLHLRRMAASSLRSVTSDLHC